MQGWALSLPISPHPVPNGHQPLEQHSETVLWRIDVFSPVEFNKVPNTPVALPSLGPLGKSAAAAPFVPGSWDSFPDLCFWEMCLGASAHPAPPPRPPRPALGLALGVLSFAPEGSPSLPLRPLFLRLHSHWLLPEVAVPHDLRPHPARAQEPSALPPTCQPFPPYVHAGPPSLPQML